MYNSYSFFVVAKSPSFWITEYSNKGILLYSRQRANVIQHLTPVERVCEGRLCIKYNNIT